MHPERALLAMLNRFYISVTCGVSRGKWTVANHEIALALQQLVRNNSCFDNKACAEEVFTGR